MKRKKGKKRQKVQRIYDDGRFDGEEARDMTRMDDQRLENSGDDVGEEVFSGAEIGEDSGEAKAVKNIQDHAKALRRHVFGDHRRRRQNLLC